MSRWFKATGGFFVTLAAFVLFHSPVPAQDAPTAAEPDDSREAGETEAVEEIIVVGGKPGDPEDLDARYEELLRARLLRDVDRQRVLEEEYAWRASEADEESSRIKWGYDPRAELRMRHESIAELEWNTSTKPATVFRVEF